MNINRAYFSPLTVLELEDRLLKIDRLVTNDDTSVYGQTRTASYVDKVCLRKTGVMEYELSENFGYTGLFETIVYCYLEDKNSNSIIHFKVINGAITSKIAIWLVGLLLTTLLTLHLVISYSANFESQILYDFKWSIIYVTGCCIVFLGYRYLRARVFVWQIVKSIGILKKYT